jgi:hypothetical protein
MNSVVELYSAVMNSLAKVSALAGCPALGAASSAPPQRSVITPSGTLNYGSFGPQTLSLGPQDRFSLSL